MFGRRKEEEKTVPSHTLLIGCAKPGEDAECVLVCHHEQFNDVSTLLMSTDADVGAAQPIDLVYDKSLTGKDSRAGVGNWQLNGQQVDLYERCNYSLSGMLSGNDDTYWRDVPPLVRIPLGKSFGMTVPEFIEQLKETFEGKYDIKDVMPQVRDVHRPQSSERSFF